VKNVFRGLIVLLAALGLSASAQGDYYGLKMGSKWSYSNGELQTLTSERTVKGQKYLVMTRSNGGKVTSEDYLLVNAQGMLLAGSRYGGKDYMYTPALIIYPAAPMTVGMTWSSQAQSPLGQYAFASRIERSEGLATPAGRFNTLVVRTSVTTSSGASTVQDAYFAPGAGVVRFVTQDGDKVDLIAR
jgi:hypothetical protein